MAFLGVSLVSAASKYEMAKLKENSDQAVLQMAGRVTKYMDCLLAAGLVGVGVCIGLGLLLSGLGHVGLYVAGGVILAAPLLLFINKCIEAHVMKRTLERALKASKEALGEQTTANASLRSTVSDLNSKLSKKNQEVETIQENYKREQAALRLAESSLTRLKNTLKTLRDAPAKDRAQLLHRTRQLGHNIASLQAEVRRKTTQISALERSIAAQKRKIETEKEVAQLARFEVQKLERQLEALRNAPPKEGDAQLRQIVTQQRALLAEETQNFVAARTALLENQAQCERLREQLAQQKNISTAQQAEIATLEAKITTQVQDLASAKEKIQKIRRRVRLLKNASQKRQAEIIQSAKSRGNAKAESYATVLSGIRVAMHELIEQHDRDIERYEERLRELQQAPRGERRPKTGSVERNPIVTNVAETVTARDAAAQKVKRVAASRCNKQDKKGKGKLRERTKVTEFNRMRKAAEQKPILAAAANSVGSAHASNGGPPPPPPPPPSTSSLHRKLTSVTDQSIPFPNEPTRPDFDEKYGDLGELGDLRDEFTELYEAEIDAYIYGTPSSQRVRRGMVEIEEIVRAKDGLESAIQAVRAIADQNAADTHEITKKRKELAELTDQRDALLAQQHRMQTADEAGETYTMHLLDRQGNSRSTIKLYPCTERETVMGDIEAVREIVASVEGDDEAAIRAEMFTLMGAGRIPTPLQYIDIYLEHFLNPSLEGLHAKIAAHEEEVAALEKAIEDRSVDIKPGMIQQLKKKENLLRIWTQFLSNLRREDVEEAVSEPEISAVERALRGNANLGNFADALQLSKIDARSLALSTQRLLARAKRMEKGEELRVGDFARVYDALFSALREEPGVLAGGEGAPGGENP